MAPGLLSGIVTNICTFGFDGLPNKPFRGGKEIGRKKGGLVEETEFAEGEKDGVLRRSARRFELLGTSPWACWDRPDISKPVVVFCPLRLDTLLREILRLIASKRSFFNSSRGRDGNSTGFLVVISDWDKDGFGIWSFDCFISLPSGSSN